MLNNNQFSKRPITSGDLCESPDSRKSIKSFQTFEIRKPISGSSSFSSRSQRIIKREKTRKCRVQSIAFNCSVDVCSDLCTPLRRLIGCSLIVRTECSTLECSFVVSRLPFGVLFGSYSLAIQQIKNYFCRSFSVMSGRLVKRLLFWKVPAIEYNLKLNIVWSGEYNPELEYSLGLLD